MTVVIPYKDDILSGVELLFALRSIDKYLTGWTNVVIIGTPPEWYRGESVYVKDCDGRKQYNIYSKLLIACELNNVSDPFIEWDDDLYLNKPLHVSDIKYWYDGLLKNVTQNGTMGSIYLEAIANTVQMIPEGVHYDLHVPIIYDKNKFKSLFSNRAEEFIIKSYYCNCVGVEGVYMKDFKINQLASKEFIHDLTKDRVFNTTSTNGMKKPMIELLNELYPEPSKFEI